MKCMFQMPARQKPSQSLDKDEYRDWSEGEEEGPDRVRQVSTDRLAAADLIHQRSAHCFPRSLPWHHGLHLQRTLMASLPTRVQYQSAVVSDRSEGYPTEMATASQLGLPQGGAVEAVLVQIGEAIDRLGGAASPKLNWSCPSDAVWVTTGNTHRCTNADEVRTPMPAFPPVSFALQRLCTR